MAVYPIDRGEDVYRMSRRYLRCREEGGPPDVLKPRVLLGQAEQGLHARGAKHGKVSDVFLGIHIAKDESRCC